MPGRHALLWLHPGARWQALTPGAQPRLQQWFAAGLPAADEGKQRLALSAGLDEVARST
ncbi:hypothetical protein XPN_4183, partial [Xanthomonas arboricola pv. pruni MAFF 301427]